MDNRKCLERFFDCRIAHYAYRDGCRLVRHQLPRCHIGWTSGNPNADVYTYAHVVCLAERADSRMIKAFFQVVEDLLEGESGTL